MIEVDEFPMGGVAATVWTQVEGNANAWKRTVDFLGFYSDIEIYSSTFEDDPFWTICVRVGDGPQLYRHEERVAFWGERRPDPPKEVKEAAMRTLAAMFSCMVSHIILDDKKTARWTETKKLRGACPPWVTDGLVAYCIGKSCATLPRYTTSLNAFQEVLRFMKNHADLGCIMDFEARLMDHIPRATPALLTALLDAPAWVLCSLFLETIQSRLAIPNAKVHYRGADLLRGAIARAIRESREFD
jgi:hypothetical protein